MYKLSIEADSLKEMLQEFSDTFEEMGCVVLKVGEEVPEELDKMLQLKDILLVRKGESLSPETVNAVIEEDPEEVYRTIIENQDSRERIIELLEAEGYQIKKENEQQDY
ncbi:hypothetical protein [Candidatus Uabimicrobium amorphum]|uniref:Uncharacterized protein n=1 Tax=Uabimicrobium amorphum TaxID=2596890 RepID=A0A5S9IQP1_UABAM|nr:hypothetical protein [Candidatus Uabimicrobium amorphum]BBM85691.1 hypothetical protein UABAM_04066 [Candidatus Uabimicrobium amorphum]